jgi:dipeptidyl aminopeptidase/acylaminoacyl peptidase
MIRAAWHALLLAAVALACFPLSACAGKATFEHGVIGVRLSDRVGTYSSWSPDGRWIAEPARVGFRLRNIGTGKVRELHAPAYQGFPERPGRLDWSGDGKTIRYATSEPRPKNGNASWLTEVSLDGSGYRHQTLGVRAQQVSWAAGGYPLAFSTGPYALDFQKGPIGPKPSLFVVDEFGATPRRVAFIPHPKREELIEGPAISPDGKRVAYERWGARRNVNIWTVRADGSKPASLVPALVSVDTIEWAPDGRTLALGAFTAKGDRRQHVYTVPAAGGRLRRIVDEEILDGPAWSPDGRWLAYSTYDGEIWRVHPDGSSRQQIAEIRGEEPRDLLWSPDSRHLAYTAAPPPPFD